MEQIVCDKIEEVHLGGTGYMFLTVIEGKDYLFKPGINKAGTCIETFRADVQKTGSEIQKIVDPKSAVDIFTGVIKLPKDSILSNYGPIYGSFQPYIDNNPSFKKDLTHWQYSNNIELGIAINNQLLRESVTDYLLCNFDQNGENFIQSKDGIVIGIDKEQSMRYLMDVDTDIDINYNPNRYYGSPEPVFHTLIKKFIDGNEHAYLPTVYSYISKIEDMSDEDYLELFKPYLDSLKASLYKSDREITEMANKILARKHNIRLAFSNIFTDAIKQRKLGLYRENKELTQMLDAISKEITPKR